MRKLFIIVPALLLASAAFTSCEDFLDKGPEENLTIDDLFADRAYTDKFLFHTYSWIPTEANLADSGGAWRNPYVGGCDEMEIAFGGAYSHHINDGSWNATSISETQVWEESYMALRKTNMFMERIQNLPKSNTASEDEVRRWSGEAHFLRAYFHFLAFRAHGPIVIADHCFDPSEDLVSIPRASVDEVVAFMVADCDKAAELLFDRNRWDDSNTGRATRLSALALKSRILLYDASPLYNGNTDLAALVCPLDNTKHLINQTYDKEKWKLAADAAKECIEACKADGRELYNKYPEDPVKNFNQIFSEIWNDEILWAKNIGTYDHHERCSDPVSFNCFAILDPTQEMVDAYAMSNGELPITGYTNDGLVPIINEKSGYKETGFTETAGPYWPKGVRNMYVDREPRFYASINFCGQQYKSNYPNYNENDPHFLEFWYTGVDGKNNAGSDYCKTGYLMKKTNNWEFKNGKYTPLNQWVYIRLGEIYLNAAEAINEYYGPADAYQYINAIRKRGGIPDLKSGLSQDEMRDWIKHERRIELAFEAHRFFDVRRWKDAEKTECLPVHSMNIMAGTSLQDEAYYERTKIEDRVFVAPKHYFFPISQTQIDLNTKKILVQNLGWEADRAIVSE